ncbi:MAG: S8 family serine peptidase, partial [Chitinophagaceae bacterium]
ANPATYLSAKALERRTKQGIAIDSTDLPISKSYIDSILSVPNVTILNRSKWLNQVLIRTSDANALTKINSFPFVKSRTGVAPRINIGSTIGAKHKIEDEQMEVDNVRVQSPTDVQLDYGSTGNQIKIHKGEFLHNLGFTGQNITISILDAGFLAYKTNPALDSVRLQGRILGEWDYVMNEASVNEDNSHGANCFTIIASNRPGNIVGSSPHSKFWLLRTEDVGSEYIVEEQNWAAGAEFTDSVGGDMISSSLGYYDFDDPSFDHSYAQRDGNTSLVTRIADLAAKKGIIVMNSAGNSGALGNDDRFVACPADGDSVVAVGAVNAAGAIASFSSWGPNGAGKIKPNIVSVGAGTVYASTAGNAVAGNGTSYSNPNMAGLIACFWQAFPELNNMQLIDAVYRSSDRYSNPDMRYGYGIPNFKKAFAMVLQQRATFAVNNANCVTTINWSSKDNNTMEYRLQRKFTTDTGFITITTVTGKSAAFQQNNYTFSYTDLQDINDNVQFRVQQVVSADTTVVVGTMGLNIASKCSDIVRPDLLITISPNPARNNVMQLHVTSNNNALPDLQIVITNMKGQIVKTVRRSAPAGTSTHPIAISNLAAGVYAVKVFS